MSDESVKLADKVVELSEKIKVLQEKQARWYQGPVAVALIGLFAGVVGAMGTTWTKSKEVELAELVHVQNLQTKYLQHIMDDRSSDEDLYERLIGFLDAVADDPGLKNWVEKEKLRVQKRFGEVEQRLEDAENERQRAEDQARQAENIVQQAEARVTELENSKESSEREVDKARAAATAARKEMARLRFEADRYANSECVPKKLAEKARELRRLSETIGVMGEDTFSEQAKKLADAFNKLHEYERRYGPLPDRK